MTDKSVHQGTIKWGSFVVRQGGITVASGSGPWEDCKREALRYSAAYQQDGPVSVTVRRRKPRVVPNVQR